MSLVSLRVLTIFVSADFIQELKSFMSFSDSCGVLIHDEDRPKSNIVRVNFIF